MTPADHLPQDEFESLVQSLREKENLDESSKRAQQYDFRRPDRIAKDQLRSIHQLHESFARSLAASLSVYLRAYVVINLVSVEQLSFMEFSQCLPSPSCLVSLGIRPFEGKGVLEINPGLVFPIIEMLLGGNAKTPLHLTREATEIEQSILDGLYRIILNDLQEAWQAVTHLEFTIASHESEPQLLQVLAPNEAVVAVSMEVRVGDNSGMMNIGIPSIVVKMLRNKFDQQWSVRRNESTNEEQSRILNLIKLAKMNLDSRLTGPTLSAEDLTNLSEGDVLTFDFPIERPLDLFLNGRLKYRGHMVSAGRKRAFHIDKLYHPLD